LYCTFHHWVLCLLLLGEKVKMTAMFSRYQQHRMTESDIQHHLGLLFSFAKGNVLELGTRSGVSTAALLAGVERHGGTVVSIDIDPACAEVAKGHPQWSFICADSRDASLPEASGGGLIDLLLIDTEHRLEITSAELELWEPHVKGGGYICLHDTETFPGVRRAIENYCAARPDLQVTYVLPCHGMGIIHKLPKADSQ